MADRVVTYLVLDMPITPRLFDSLLTRCLEFGCTATQDGDSDTFNLNVRDPAKCSTDASKQRVVNELAEAEFASVELWYRDIKVYISKNSITETEPSGPSFPVSIWNSQFKQYPPESAAGVEGRVRQFAAIVELLFSVSGAVVGYGGLGRIPGGKHPPVQQLECGDPKILGWLNVYSPGVIEEFDCVLGELPWHYYHELDDGGALCVTTPTPIEFGARNEVTATIASVLGVEIASFR